MALSNRRRARSETSLPLPQQFPKFRTWFFGAFTKAVIGYADAPRKFAGKILYNLRVLPNTRPRVIAVCEE